MHEIGDGSGRAKSDTTADLAEPFRIAVSDETLEDLRSRLMSTRWSDDLNNEDCYYGISTSYLRSLADYWIHEFNWRSVEEQLNSFHNYKVEIDGSPIHFIRERGRGPAPMPIILTHGWPWTHWHWRKVIRPLTDPAAFGGDPADAFDVIVPSVPGFGFSTPLSQHDMNFWKVADLWQKLMTEVLGYKKYAAAGADNGGVVSAQLGHKYASSLYGIHLGCEFPPLTIFQNERPWDLTGGQLVPEDSSPQLRADILAWQATYASHVAVHMLDGQTITHGLNDSPVGLLAWLIQRWMKWSDRNGDFETAFPKDDILTWTMIYWVTESIGSSIRAYANVTRYPWRPSHDRQPVIEAPAGFTLLTGDTFPPGATVENRLEIFRNGPQAKMYNTIYAKAHAKGGHFVPWENPEAVIDDVRSTFRSLRS